LSNNPWVHAVFPVVLFGSIGLFVVVGVLSMLTRNNLHDQIGQGGLFVGEDSYGGGFSAPPPGSGEWGAPAGWDEGAVAEGGENPGGAGAGSPSERELEIRQMLEARNERLVRRGEAPVDVDAELARLDPPPGAAGAGAHDPALTAEVRQLVVARNERRRRQGLEPLDVEAEVRRTLAELDP
jgi:hypothetical protein